MLLFQISKIVKTNLLEKYKQMLETSSRDLFLANVDLETNQVLSQSLQDGINSKGPFFAIKISMHA